MSVVELEMTTGVCEERDPDVSAIDGPGDEPQDLPRAVATSPLTPFPPATGEDEATVAAATATATATATTITTATATAIATTVTTVTTATTAVPPAPDGTNMAVFQVIAPDSLSAATLATLSSPEPSDISIVVCEESHLDQRPISDPIEGRDSEFDVELSSSSSVHSLSPSGSIHSLSPSSSIHSLSLHSGSCTQRPAALTIGIVADESHLDGPERYHEVVSEDDEGALTAVGGSAVSQHPTLYGKVVKSIQKSIRRIFHCGRDNLKSTQVVDSASASTTPVTSSECFTGCASCVQHEIQHEVPMTSIQTLNSPIASALPGAPPPSATLHKTLVIDVAYSTPLLSKPFEGDIGKKCLVLDLDETLVHSTFQPVPNADLVVPVHLGEGVFQPIYVCKRPGVDEFLRAVSGLFEVVLFTASLSNYADPVIDFLDPIGGIRHRLYREDCLQFQGMYIKDLSRLGRDPDQILIIDNSPASYSMQPHAALGCRSWFKDPHDRELQDRILPMLFALDQSPSVSQWRNENLESIETPYCCL